MVLTSAVWISFIVLAQQLLCTKSDDFSVPKISDSSIPTITPFDNENELKSELYSESQTVRDVPELNLRTDSNSLACVNSHNCSNGATTPSTAHQTLSTLSRITWNPVHVLKVSSDSSDLLVSDESVTNRMSDSSLSQVHSTLPIPSTSIPIVHSNETVYYHNGNELDSVVLQPGINSLHSSILTDSPELTTHEYTGHLSEEAISESIQSESIAVTNHEAAPESNFIDVNSTNPVLTEVFVTSTRASQHETENSKDPSVVTESVPATITDSSFHSEQDAESSLPDDLNLINATLSDGIVSPSIHKDLNIDEISTLSSKESNTNEITTLSSKESNTNEITTLSSKESNTNEITTLSSKGLQIEEVTKEIIIDEVTTSSSKEPNINEVTTSTTNEPNIEVTISSTKEPNSDEILARQNSKTPKAIQSEKSQVIGETTMTPVSLNTNNNLVASVSVDVESHKTVSDISSTETSFIDKNSENSSKETLARSSKNARLDAESETSPPAVSFSDISSSLVVSETTTSTLTETTYRNETTVLELAKTTSPSTEFSIDPEISTVEGTINTITENSTADSSNFSELTSIGDSQSTTVREDNDLTSETSSSDDFSTVDAETFINNNVFEITDQITEEAPATLSKEDDSDPASINPDSEIKTDFTEEAEIVTSTTDKEFHLSSEALEMTFDTTPIPNLFRIPQINDSFTTSHYGEKYENVSETTTHLVSDDITVSSVPTISETSVVSVDEISSTDSVQSKSTLPSDYFYPIENVSDSLSRNITHLFESGVSSATIPENGASSIITSESDALSTTTLEEDVTARLVSTETSDSTTFTETYSTVETETDTMIPSDDAENGTQLSTVSTETPISNLFTMATHREGKHIPFSTTNSKDKSEESPSGGVIVVTTSHEIQGTEKSLKMIPLLQREYEDLSSEQKANIITSVVQLPSNYNSEDAINEKVAQIHQWMHNALETEYENRTRNYLSEDVKSKVDAANKHSLELIYVHPTPEVHFSNISLTFYAYDNTLNDTLPAYFLLSSLRTKSEELLSLVNANATYFYRGLSPEKYDFLTIIIEKYGTIVAATCLAALVLIILLACVVIYYRRKTRYSAHNLTNTKLHRNMQEAMGLDLNPAVVILQDELKEKVMNGNKVCSLDDNEGWLVPFTDVPLAEEKDAPRVQDTKL